MPIPSLVFPGAALAVAVVSLLFVFVFWTKLRHKDRLFAERLGDGELDRERLQATFERGQHELTRATTHLAIYETERLSMQQELLRQQAAAADCRNELAQASDQTAALQRKQRELNDRLNQALTTRDELQAEKQNHEETKKSVAVTRLQLDKLRRDSAETQKLLLLERSRLSDKNKQYTAEQAEAQRLRDELAIQNATFAELTLRLSTIGELETDVAQLRDRNADLESKLTSVVQVASTVDAVELDREELQVRLDMAAASVRIARNEADRYRARTESLESDLGRLRDEHKTLQAAALQQQGLIAENRKLGYQQAQHQKEQLVLQARLDEQRREAELATTQANQSAQELERLQSQADESEVQRRTLLAQVTSLHQYTTQNEELRAEISNLSKVNQERHRLQAELENVKTELRLSQTSLRAASANAQELERLRQTAQLLRDEQQSHIEAERRLLAVQAELQALKGGITAVHGKRMETEQIEQLRDENLKLKDDLRQLRIHEKSTEELERLTAEHKRLRLDSELLTQRVEDLTTAKQEATDLRRQWEEQSHVLNEAIELRDKQGLLEAQLYALGQIPQTRQIPRHSLRIEVGSKSHDIETGLSPLLASTSLRSVVLGDVQGFPVVAAGETLTHEGLAAFSAVAQDTAERSRRLLPLSDVLMVHLVDSNRMTVSCRLFTLGQESFSIVTIGNEALDIAKADEVVETLRKKMTRTT